MKQWLMMCWIGWASFSLLALAEEKTDAVEEPSQEEFTRLPFPESVEEHEDLRSVLDARYIFATTRADLGVPFEDARRMLTQEKDLLMRVQSAYAELLELNGEEAEFSIHETEELGVYIYKTGNPKHDTHMVELFRDLSPEGNPQLLLYSAGKRGFGRFRALTFVEIQPEKEEAVYQVDVYAFPQNSFNRFFARKLGVVERYFKKKTADLSETSTEICLHILEQGGVRPTELASENHPEPTESHP